MKNFSILLFSLALLQATTYAQSCLPDGIIFTTQAEIDDFQTNYPGCTEIEGNVEINGNDITNLDGLNVLTSFWGNVWIYFNDDLTSLSGLENITSVGGILHIGFHLLLSSTSALNNLTTIGGGLSIKENYALTDLSGFENVTTIGGDLEIENNPSLTSISALNVLTTVGGYVTIENNSMMSELLAFNNLTSVGQGLVFKNNAALTGLSDLFSLTSIGNGYSIWIEGNDALLSLTGLDNIEAASIGGLYIFNNTSLSTCEVQSVCDYLASPYGTVSIHDNAMGCNTVAEVEEACETVSVEDVEIKDRCTIYPNPTSGFSSFRFQVSSSEHVTLKVYDLHGREVATVLDKVMPPGEHMVKFNARQLSPGIYILHKSAIGNQKSEINKLLVVR
jgi:hypothetical protein